MINEWNVELLLHIVQYLNAADLAKISVQSRRWYYIVHQYQSNRGAQCVSVASYRPVRGNRQGTHLTPTQMYDQAISDVQGPPQLLLSFSSTEPGLHQSPMHTTVTDRSPSDMVYLDCVADKIQTSGIPHGKEDRQRKPESKSQVAWTMFSGMASNVTIQPFLCSHYQDRDFPGAAAYVDQHFDATLNWKLVILYLAGDFDMLAQAFIRRMQAKFPDVVVVGGVCRAAHVSGRMPASALDPVLDFLAQMANGSSAQVHNERQRRKYAIRSISADHYTLGGICGVALAGDVPFRAVVSRGVERSMFAQHLPGDASRAPTSSFSIHEAEFREDTLRLDGDNVSPYHVLHSVREEGTGKIVRGQDMMVLQQLSDFVGTQLPHEDGFLLENPYGKRVHDTSLAVTTRADCRSLVGASIDFYSFTGEQSVTDMEFCMHELRQETANDKVLAGFLFLCNGRGPRPKRTFIPKEMSDAKCWARHFPNVPCTGFYALGEFGPSPRAGRHSIVETDHSSHKLQLTAVVLLFIAPAVDLQNAGTIEDTEEAILEFVRRRLMNDTMPSRPTKRQRQSNS